MSTERALSRIQGRVSAAQRRVMQAVQLNRPSEAIKHSRRAESHVKTLARRDPQTPYHNFVLAGLLYNRAIFHEAVRDAEGALSSIRRAVHIYLEFDPSHGEAEAVRALIRGNRTDRDSMEELIGSAADARARLARLLAVFEGVSATEVIKHHGLGAIATYKELTRYGSRYDRDDLRRVERQHREAKRVLERTTP